MYKLNKRGIGITFDWIFSIVAGVLIFSFLIYFAVQNTDLFGKVTARIVAEELDILFSGYETTQTKSVLDFDKNVKLDFSCDKINKRQRFMINDREGKNLWGKIIFSPKSVESDKINVATVSWDVPFRVANFIFIWDKEYRINEIYETDSELIDKFKGAGEEIEIQEYNEGIDCKGAKKGIKTIYYSDTGEGQVCFKGSNDPIKFFGEAMMVGAVLSDKDNYLCIKDAINMKLEIMRKVFENKKNNLVGSNKFCNEDYSILVNRIPTNVDDLDYSGFKLLKDRNTDLIVKGCASVF